MKRQLATADEGYSGTVTSIRGSVVDVIFPDSITRLAAMQAAEKNIFEMEETLQGKFRETRQNAITAELLDIVSGFEALTPQ